MHNPTPHHHCRLTSHIRCTTSHIRACITPPQTKTTTHTTLTKNTNTHHHCRPTSHIRCTHGQGTTCTTHRYYITHHTRAASSEQHYTPTTVDQNQYPQPNTHHHCRLTSHIRCTTSHIRACITLPQTKTTTHTTLTKNTNTHHHCRPTSQSSTQDKVTT